MRLSKVKVAGKFPIGNFSFPVVSVYPSWPFQASPLGAQESILLDCILHTQHRTADIQSPRDKHTSMFQLSCGSQHPPLKAGQVFSMDWAFPSSPDTAGSSAPQPEEEGVLALLAVQGVILVIKIQNVLLGLKSKLLVEQHCRVACRDVKGDVLAHAGLPREAGGKKEISLQENETASGGMRR